MAEREIDWRVFVNRLVYCYGCGRFGMPRAGMKQPKGWTTLYQPHSEGPPGLSVCSAPCASAVREAMAKGPVTGPLRMTTDVTMMAEMRAGMFEEAIQHAIDEGRMDDLFVDALTDDDDEKT